MASSFFNSNNCPRTALEKKLRLCTQVAAGACKVCMRLAASRKQIVPVWPPVACKLYPRVRLTFQVTALGYLVWKMRWYYGWQSNGSKFCTRQRPIACKDASFLQACCENNYLNKKMKTPLKNLRIYATHVLYKCYPSTLRMARANLIRWYL